MKKIVIALFVALLVAPLSFAYSTGSYETTSNLNVRYSPAMGNNRIDYIALGETVNVIEVKGNWCKINHFKYDPAYVHCAYLKETDQISKYINVIPSKVLRDAKYTIFMQGEGQELLDFYDTFINSLFVGKQSAKTNLNIRSLPSINGKRLGYFKKGENINVKSVIGDWCGVEYRDYEKAYVYCGYLNLNVEEIFKTAMSALESDAPSYSEAQYLLEKLETWLMENDESGREFINSSSRKGIEKAKEWAEDAERAAFTFDYTMIEGESCVHNYVSESKPDEVFQFACVDEDEEGIGVVVTRGNVSYIGDPIDPEFKVPLAALVQTLVHDYDLMQAVNEEFAGGPGVEFRFVLSTTDEGTYWDIVIVDELNDRMELRMDGTDAGADIVITG